MRLKYLSVFAAALLLSACETTQEEETQTTGGGSVEAPAPTAEPTGPVPGSQEDLLLKVGDRVFFDFDRSDLSSDSQDTLQKLAAWMTTYPNVTINLEGHCDERGTRDYNLALGEAAGHGGAGLPCRARRQCRAADYDQLWYRNARRCLAPTRKPGRRIAETSSSLTKSSFGTRHDAAARASQEARHPGGCARCPDAIFLPRNHVK